MIRLKFTVGEPWDFTSSDGDNVLFCTADLANSGSGSYGDWLIVDCTPFVAKDASIDSLLMTARHVGHSVLGELPLGMKINVNAYWHMAGATWELSLVRDAELEPQKTIGGFLIGEVHMVL